MAEQRQVRDISADAANPRLETWLPVTADRAYGVAER
jgi:hypothetical protein